MNILFLTPQLPYPPHQGTAMRNFGLVQGLSERHQISLLSFHQAQTNDLPTSTPEIPAPLLALCERVETVAAPATRPLTRRGLDTFTRRLPDMALRLASRTFANRLAAWLAREPFDIVHVEGIEMTPYLDVLLGRRTHDTAGTLEHSQTEQKWRDGTRHRHPLVIFDDHNCEYLLQKSYAKIDARTPRRWLGALYSLMQWQKLRYYEAQVCRRAHQVLAVSQTDADALQQIVPGLNVTVIPNGIDTSHFRPDQITDTSAPDMEGAPTLVFTGKMDFRPNVDAVRWFADSIWPQVRDKVPEARFLAVGQRPHPKLDYLRADPSVTLTGWVEEIRPYIGRATVYIAPLRMGSGTRLKLLQAMAMGKAIVSTRMGAEGLTDLMSEQPPTNVNQVESASRRVTDDKEMVLVDDNDPLAFADAIVALLRDPSQRGRLGTAAQAFARAHYDWRVIIPRLEALYTRS